MGFLGDINEGTIYRGVGRVKRIGMGVLRNQGQEIRGSHYEPLELHGQGEEKNCLFFWSLWKLDLWKLVPWQKL